MSESNDADRPARGGGAPRASCAGWAWRPAAPPRRPVPGARRRSADETPEEQAKGRYQDNEHAKRFYALNRL